MDDFFRKEKRLTKQSNYLQLTDEKTWSAAWQIRCIGNPLEDDHAAEVTKDAHEEKHLGDELAEDVQSPLEVPTKYENI